MTIKNNEFIYFILDNGFSYGKLAFGDWMYTPEFKYDLLHGYRYYFYKDIQIRLDGVCVYVIYKHKCINTFLLYETPSWGEVIKNFYEIPKKVINLIIHKDPDYLPPKEKPYRYISIKIRLELLEKHNHKCNFCGSSWFLEIDHILPVSKGGSNDKTNLQVLCRSCNRKKHAKILTA